MEEFILQQNETYEFKYKPEKGMKCEKIFKKYNAETGKSGCY